MKVEVINPGIRVKYVPTADDIKHCAEFGQRIGKAMKVGT